MSGKEQAAPVLPTDSSTESAEHQPLVESTTVSPRQRRVSVVAALGVVLVLSVVVLAGSGLRGPAIGRHSGVVSLAEQQPAGQHVDCDKSDPSKDCHVGFKELPDEPQPKQETSEAEPAAEPAAKKPEDEHKTGRGDSADDSDWQDKVAQLEKQAAEMKEKAEKSMESAKVVEDKAKKNLDAAQAVKDGAEKKLKDAEDMVKQAKDMRHDASKAKKQAKKLEKDADEVTQEAGELEAKAANKEDEAATIQEKADAIKKKADSEFKKADDIKEGAMKEINKHRECMDMPGIQLSPGTSPLLEAEGDKDIWSAEICRERCLENTDCGLMVWIGWKNGCYLYQSAEGSTPKVFKDIYNSSYCGFKTEHAELKKKLDAIYDVAPYVPPIQTCSYSGDDCSETKCCNDVYCNEDFSDCRGYTCYKQDEYFSGCLLDAPDFDGWDGSVVGYPREPREIPPAPEGKLVQGSTLFCFSVINWDTPAPKAFWASEREMAAHIKENQLSVFQCDAGDFFSGYATPKAEWGSFSNIDAFVNVWQQVKDDGRWQAYDWTVKVDADAVFFPNRLKDHLYKLRTPLGSRVYLRNINYQFQFMGALEIYTREALETYFEKGEECLRGEHKGGEDFFMRLCMDSIGVDHQTDFELLRDKYCLTCEDRDDPCDDGWHVAYHFHKKMISWDWCYNEAVCGGRAGDCPEGLKVEYVMPVGE
jgi:hypothetical protein